MKRLGLNAGKYLGEGIDIHRVMAGIWQAAEDHGWESEVFLKTAAYELVALMRRVKNAKNRIYISTGIHGDEPAGPLAVLQMLQENQWPADTEVWLCPCLNPTGFPESRRENGKGFDLNRQYLDTEAEEVLAHIEWLKHQPGFDVSLCLHEDWESHGFYVYELNPDDQRSYAEDIVRGVEKVCPIDMSPVIEGRDAKDGIIRPSIDPRSRPQWPEAFYLLTYKTRLSYTMEAPSDFQLVTRVAAIVAGVRAVLESMQRRQA